MKKKVKEEFKLKTAQELKKLLKDTQELLFKTKMDKVQNKLKNQRQIFTERKKIAFFLTLLNEKEKEETANKAMKAKESKKEVKENA